MTRIRDAGNNAGWLDGCNNANTVVFVHGLKGSYETTWGRFPELVRHDPDLPYLDILSWGYRTGVINPLVGDAQTVGRHLVSEVRACVDDTNDIYLAGHSLGGLVILRGLVDELLKRRGEMTPVTSVRQISLYASPLSGNMVLKILGARRWWPSKSIRSLSSDDCEELLAEVYSRIYDPDSDDVCHRCVPIRIIMAARDMAVSRDDKNATRAKYTKLPPLEYDYGHKDIKLPENRLDPRYRSLGVDLQLRTMRQFRKICEDCRSADEDTRIEAEIELELRFGELLRARLNESGIDPDEFRGIYHEFKQYVIDSGIRRERPAFHAANRALVAMREFGQLR